MPETTVTIIVVFHCYEPDTNKATVWLVPGKYTADDPMPDEDPRPIKIGGPFPQPVSSALEAGLKRAFEEMQIGVAVHHWPDD